MTIYVPNVGEKELLKDLLLSQAIVLGLYKNLIVPDGSTIIDTLEELTTGGGRGYAQKALTNNLVEGAVAADKWAVSMNSAGKAESQYHNAALEWLFTAVDVADGATAYGIFGYTWVLPFDAGAKEIKVGDTIKGATSAATGIVTAVEVQSGTWGGNPTAAGNLKIKTKTGTFQDGENILVLGEVGTLNATPTAGGTGYAVGDLVQITTGGVGALAIVGTVNAGVVESIYLATGGHGYTTGTGKVTAKITGGGDNALTVNITALAAVTYAVTNTGVTADAHRKLLFTEAFTAGQAITLTGQKITYIPKLTLSTA